MATKYKYPLDQWDKAKEEMRQVLISRAALRGTIPYSELVQKVHAIRLEPDAYPFHAMLGEISTAEDQAGRGMLTVIVVHKDGDMQPGPGFFNLAGRLGHDTSDRLTFWVGELDKVYAAWSG
jgi:hypothetical protein